MCGNACTLQNYYYYNIIIRSSSSSSLVIVQNPPPSPRTTTTRNSSDTIQEKRTTTPISEQPRRPTQTSNRTPTSARTRKRLQKVQSSTVGTKKASFSTPRRPRRRRKMCSPFVANSSLPDSARTKKTLLQRRTSRSRRRLSLQSRRPRNSPRWYSRSSRFRFCFRRR